MIFTLVKGSNSVAEAQFFEIYVETYENLLLAFEAVWSKICGLGLMIMRKGHFSTL
jgi:hypothetical protein